MQISVMEDLDTNLLEESHNRIQQLIASTHPMQISVTENLATNFLAESRNRIQQHSQSCNADTSDGKTLLQT